jgi:hypothetical protein
VLGGCGELVERILIEVDVTSKPDLERAAAIDKAASQLILRAAITRLLLRCPGLNWPEHSRELIDYVAVACGTPTASPAGRQRVDLSHIKRRLDRALPVR